MRLKYNLCLLLCLMLWACENSQDGGTTAFQPNEESSRPWVYWYWMHNAYSKEGITADLEAMAEAGIGGAYLMSIKGPTDPPFIDPPIHQLSDEWWEMVTHAMKEATRLGLKIAMHAADGFAVAGGPWITPENSMQKVVWADTLISGGRDVAFQLPQPEMVEHYYNDIAVFALPQKKNYRTSREMVPEVSSSLIGEDVSFLAIAGEDGNFRLDEKGFIQYEFAEPFSLNSITVKTKGNNYQAHRLTIEASDDGENFTEVGRLEPPRHGWQDSHVSYTHTIEPVTAKYFRLIYDPEGTEPGSEDLDSAKWRQSLKVSKITFSEEPLIDNYQGKSGAVWRISPRMTSAHIPDDATISKDEMINISEFVDEDGNLGWEAPVGDWKIMRFGHTSTGQENETGGAGKGLEVDKFNPEAIRFQFDKWFGEAVRQAGPEVASEVLKVFHIDSWEAGSQNWSPVFRDEFEKRRGYDIVEYLPVMAGIPIENVQTSEAVLHDVRKTISELITDNFFGTMAEEAEKVGAKFSSENVAPTMVSDALLHFKNVDYPAGEFWLRSPTHDKPNDMLDAISGGHIYGKNIIQAEAYTQLRMDWNEHPGNLKALGDLHYALGVNRFFYHVFVHNPWTDRKPGMTLDGIGTFIQRDQTWWGPAKAWIDYARRIQFLLQQGTPVVDLAVFSGEEIPSRAVLPDRLVLFLPGIFGEERVMVEKDRLANKDLPVARMPKEVTYSENTTDLTDWVNSLNGYHYDSFNPDVLLNDARVENGNVLFKGAIEYKALIFPGSRRMSPNKMISLPVAEKILNLVKQGATVFVDEKPEYLSGHSNASERDQWQNIINELWAEDSGSTKEKSISSWEIGEGRVIRLPYKENNFTRIGVEPDILFPGLEAKERENFAWAHRRTTDQDTYFVSNQKEESQQIEVSFRIDGKVPELFDPVLNETKSLKEWRRENGRTIIPLEFAENQSLFVIFREETKNEKLQKGKNWSKFEDLETINGEWSISFDPEYHGPTQEVKTNELFDWSTSSNDSIKFYSGTAEYTNNFTWDGSQANELWLELGELANIAEVSLNGQELGVVWTYPYRIKISEAIRKGDNQLKIKVTNTWANRLIGDQELPEEERLTWTTAPFRLKGEPLLKAGLLGPVKIREEKPIEE